MAPIESRHPVILMQQNVSVQAIAEALAKSVRLEAVVQDNQIFLVKPQSGEVREVSYRINDLVIGGDQGALVEILQEFALDAAGRAEIVPDDTGIVIRQSTAAQYDVLVFTERLRKARGMTTRSKYPTGLIHETPRLAQLESRLSRRTTFAFIDWTPLADVFSYWQESSGIGMVVDWQSLSLAERRPMSTMAGSVDRATWREALTTCLEPLGLDWVPIDGQAIWITTRQAARDFTWVEFYPADSLTELPSRHRTADGLREELSERCDLDSVAGARLRDDPAGKLVLVRGNRHIHQTIASLQGSSPVPLP